MLISKETMMDIEVQNTENELLNLDPIIKEIPISASSTGEVNDYVMYYYGLARYDLWHSQLEK